MVMDRRSLLVGVVIGVAAAGCRDASRAAGPPPSPVVKVTSVVQRDVPISGEWVGTLVGSIDAQIRARVSGHLVSQSYTEGSLVKSGDLLFQVDSRPFQTAVDQADAKLRLAESQLSQARAQVSASRAQVEQARAAVVQAEAQVGATTIWAIAGGLSGPLFNWGRTTGSYRASIAQWDQAKFQYERVVLTALREVSDGLTALGKLSDAETGQARSVHALGDAVEHATDRYRQGLASYYEVLEAQQQLYPAQTELAQIRRGRLLTYVRLYKALGGGWSLGDTEWIGPSGS